MDRTRPETTEDTETSIHALTKEKCDKTLWKMSVFGNILSTSQCLPCHPVLLQDIFPHWCAKSTPPPFSRGVSFESLSSISRTQLYSNAIRQGIKGASIICIAHHLPFMALKESNLKQTNGITMLLFMEKYNPGLCYCNEKLPSQLGEESMHLYYFTLAAALCNRWAMIFGRMVPL